MGMDIIILAAIAIVIFFKLISQFGKVDEDQKRDAIKGFIIEQTKINKAKDQINDDKSNVTVISTLGIAEKLPPIDEKSQKILDAVSVIIKADLIKVLEKTNLSAANFIMGATRAFEMIIEAFASGDLEILKPLLSDKLMQQFELVINDRKDSGNSFNTRIFAVEKSEIISAKIIENEALVTVKFVSKQINYVTNSSGKVIEGSKEQVNTLLDSWTFKKDISASNPNWLVTSTSTQQN